MSNDDEQSEETWTDTDEKRMKKMQRELEKLKSRRSDVIKSTVGVINYILSSS